MQSSEGRSERISRSAFLWLFAGLLLSAPASASSWEKIDDENGIRVFRKEVAGSSVVAFRGEATVEAPIEKVLWVLGDNTHRTEWVDRLEKSVVLERKGPYESIVYQHFSLPFPASDRDYVYRGKATRDKSGVVTLLLESVTHPKAPATVGVRANLIKSRYLLTPKGKDRTFVVVEIHTDPMGSLPSFLVNLVQKSWPMKTLEGLRAHLKKSYIGTTALPPME
jgi:hypothetical protein